MLPALAAQRRPSKSAIVNQSIALLTSQRRGRIIAGRELRLIKTENDALRQELNEWRARNSLPRVEEPPRSGDLIALLAVEEEAEGDEELMNMMINSRRAAFEMGGDDDDYNEDGDEDQQQQVSPDSAHPYGAAMALPSVHHKVVPPVHHQQQQHQQQQQQQAAHYAAAQQQQQQQAAIFEQQKAAMARAQMAAARANYAPQQQQVFSAPDNFFASDMYEYPSAPTQNWSQKTAANSLATPPGTAHGLKEPSPYASTANSAFLSSSPYGAHGHHNAQNLGMFKPAGSTGRARSEDADSVGESTGSSHFSSVSDLGNMTLSSSPVDHTFSFNMGMMQMPMNMNMMVPMMGGGMNGMSGMNMMGMHHAPPSPPHSVSPSGSQHGSRRPSVNIPSAYAGSGNGSKHTSPGPSPVPTPTPSQGQFVGMGLMM